MVLSKSTRQMVVHYQFLPWVICPLSFEMFWFLLLSPQVYFLLDSLLKIILTSSFSSSACVVQDRVSERMITRGPKEGRLFLINPSPASIASSSFISCNAVKISTKDWHRCLGHPNPNVLQTLFKFGAIDNKNSVSMETISFDCTSCKLAKSKVLPFPQSGSHASRVIDIIHSDVWGISPVISHAHYKYFVIFIDDCHSFTLIYFLRTKSEVFSVFKASLALIQTQFASSIKVLRYDSGGEYMSHEFQNFFQERCILSQRSCASTPQQNGVAEHKNRHLIDMVRALLIDSSVPSRFWCEALATVVHLINRLPTPVLHNVSPYSILFGHTPNYSDLHIFDCVCFVHLAPHERHELTAQFVKGAFLGYSSTQKGFLCYDPNAQRIRISKNVLFFETQQFFLSHVDPISPNFSILHDEPEPFLMPIPDTFFSPVAQFKRGFVYT